MPPLPLGTVVSLEAGTYDTAHTCCGLHWPTPTYRRRGKTTAIMWCGRFRGRCGSSLQVSLEVLSVTALASAEVEVVRLPASTIVIPSRFPRADLRQGARKSTHLFTAFSINQPHATRRDNAPLCKQKAEHRIFIRTSKSILAYIDVWSISLWHPHM